MDGRILRGPVQLVCIVAILAGLLAVPAAGTPQVFAGHTASPTRVTVPGSLGSELGCTATSSNAGGDWEPGCNTNPGVTPATPDPLQANDLADQGNGVWARSLGPIPAGSYEYKVAINGNWAENYGSNFQLNGPNFALTLAAPGSVKFYYDHKTHYIANDLADTIYTVPGSFNGELGCAGDWQPECLRTLMSDVDGDGTFTFETEELPAGSYEFKVATDESWSNPNYGQNGGGDNIAFSVPANGLKVTFSFDSDTNIPTVAVAEPPPPPPADKALLRAPVSDPANQDEVIYFVLTDRFANGDNTNNTGGIAGTAVNHGFKPDDKGYYHGGDLKGLQAKLPYLKSLGVSAIWMTPPFKNKPVQGDGTVGGSSAAYHGYWIVDFTQIDPHLGTNQDMKSLVAAANAAGIRVIFDVVTNHTADVIGYVGSDNKYVTRADAPYRDAGGNLIDDRDYLDAESFPELNRYSFPRRPLVRNPAEASIKVPAWLNDVTNYHNRGEAEYDGSEAERYGDIAGLDDLFTEKPEVVEGLTEAYKYWIKEFGIDGFRIDTAKHVNDEFWNQFIPEIRSYAAAQGKPNFYVYGEVLNGDPAYLSRFTRETAFPAVLDFNFNFSAGDFAVGSQGPGRLSGLFASDDYYTTAAKNAYNLPTFIGNHDIGRFGDRMRQPFAGDADDSERTARMLLGYGLMFTARGVPIVYYGDEQGFTGDGDDKDARQSLFASQVASYNDDNLIGTDSTTAVDNYNTNHPLYKGIAELAALRKAHPALQKGAQIERLAEGGSAGVYAFSRIDRGEKIEYVVALNNANAARTVSIQTFAPADTAFAALRGATGSVSANGAGQISVTVPALGMVIYRQQAAAPAGTGALGPIVTISAPANGSTVEPGLLELAATVSGNVLAEVTFAVSVDGGAYQPIGTDTNAPYRVFYDTSKLPGGTSLSFKAVSTNVLGAADNFFSATTTVTTAAPDVCTVSYEYAVIHYQRADGNYDGWTLYPFGDGVTEPDYNTGSIPFAGRTDFGAFAWVKLDDSTKPLNFIIHNNADGSDEKENGPAGDDSFTITPKDTPQAFVKSGDPTAHDSQAAAQGFVTIHYKGDSDNSDTVVYAFGDGLAAEELTNHPTSEYPGDRGFTGSDDFGATVQIKVGDPTKSIGFIIIEAGEKDPANSPDRVIIPAAQPNAWVNSGDAATYRSRSEAENVVTLRYHRPAGDYSGGPNPQDKWGLHLWAGSDPSAIPSDYLTDPFLPNLPQDDFGIGFRVPLLPDATNWAYILHKGDTKDKQADQFLNLEQTGHEVWILQEMPGSYPYLLPMQPGCALGQGNIIAKQRAHWVSADTIAWPIVASDQVSYQLHYKLDGGMGFAEGDVTGGMTATLTLVPGGLSADLRAKFPHLADFTALRLPAGLDAKQLLKGQLIVSARTAEQGVVEATGVQIPGALDAIYATAAATQKLGVSYGTQANAPIGLKLWAPTAQDVDLLLFADATTATSSTVQMTLDAASGVWSASLPATSNGQYYLYRVQVFVPSTGKVETNLVTDPYAVSLSTNSRRSQLVNLASPAVKPAGWDTTAKPALEAFEDIVLYELHVRDFSVYDTSVPAAQRGTFKAFTQANSNGMRHLRQLAQDGLTHVHLLPVFDIATINEDPAQRQEPSAAALAAGVPNKENAANEVERVRGQDGFNWGYDPYHYNVPEGSYSTNPNGTTRIVEFREMVRALNGSGLRVVMDVVYNHTNASGQAEKSVLDKVVPGYYHRLNLDGQVETSTCCANTASEHAMMEKLMVDSLVQWAKEYKVDGFRFDLMGHHTKANMLKVRAALDALTLAKDGVDGSKIYVYGEGWNFGEVADGRRGVNATQRNMAGTGIGTFSDRLRDAVRGGGPFSGLQEQGLITGLFYDPNSTNQGTPEQQKAALLADADMTKVGMAGNLATFPLTNSAGQQVQGADVDYNGSPGGYTADPQEVITYVEAHDNETLFDAIQVKAAATATLADRIRMQNLGISIVMLGQGVPFFQAGQEILRSKSGDRNSYDSGDWFNRLDYTYNTNNWGAGLPPLESRDRWDVLRPLLGNPTLKPSKPQIVGAYEHFREVLRIRKSSPLFRLRTAAEINSQVSFLNNGPSQAPGLLVMRIQDNAPRDLDPWSEQLVVLVNAGDTAVTFTATELRGLRLGLHPEQRRSLDAAVKGATFNAATGTFSIPARTTAVFVDQVQLFMPFVWR